MEESSIASTTNSDTSLLKNQLSLYEALSIGTGINGILAASEQYFNTPIFVCDVSYNIIAASFLSKNMTYGVKYSKGIAYLDSIVIKNLKQYKLLEKIYSHTTAFQAITPDQPTNPWIFCAIRIHNVVAGHVAICYNKLKPDNNDLIIATVTAQVLSLEMQKHDFFVSKTGLKYEYFLTNLLEGQFEDIETIHSRLQLIGKKLDKYICFVTISCDDLSDNDLFNKKQMEQLRSRYVDSMSLVYKNNIVLLISQDHPIKFTDNKLHNLIDFLSRNHAKAGISQTFTNPLDAGIYYKQSLKTLRIGKVHSLKQLIFNASDMVLFNILSNCKYGELKSYITYQINELQQYDDTYHSELTHTLKTYLKQNRNTTQTATYLHIHRSTLFYRIKKIEELLSFSINDSKSLFFYELSFNIYEYFYSIRKKLSTQEYSNYKS